MCDPGLKFTELILIGIDNDRMMMIDGDDGVDADDVDIDSKWRFNYHFKQ